MGSEQLNEAFYNNNRGLFFLRKGEVKDRNGGDGWRVELQQTLHLGSPWHAALQVLATLGQWPDLGK